ncbi:MAG: hypothetical protein E7458_09835, partial [Ruminococcaceae bacterium]|nr:hypothetical protein [Oscillospiraceae bacterium]
MRRRKRSESMTNPLLMPLALRHITLPGRAVRSATELFNGAPDGHVRPAEIAVYQELADKNLGLIIGANTCVSPEGRSNDYQTALWSDEFLPDARAIAAAASSAGSRVILQLGHGGHQSEGHNGGRKVMTPDNMTKDEIKALVKAFGAAAGRARSAGFDGVMIHAAHTFLLSTFFYSFSNHRTDEYGGSAENRFRVIREVFEEIKTVCGEDTPVFMKINGDDRENSPEYHADLVTALTLCDRMGMDAVEISGMQAIQKGRSAGPYFLHRIRALHEACDIPLISVGGVRKMADVEALFA